MKLPITFSEFKSDPSKAIMFLLLGVPCERVILPSRRAEQSNKRTLREAAANV
jgi:hypothetical protein